MSLERKIGTAIVDLMRAKSITKKQLATQIGCSEYTIYKCIYGQKCSQHIHQQVCRYLGYESRTQLETVALEAQAASRECILGKKVAHV